MNERYDMVIIGSGFGGTLTAMIAHKLGLRVVLIERDRHPRFTIGESSTPLANLKLQALAERYDFPWLTPLCKYGPWQKTYPGIACGLKRGFSFFRHQSGKPFRPRRDHSNELLVTANPDRERGDTHWFRADFDAFLVERAVEAGVPYLDNFKLESVWHEDGWRVVGHRDDAPLEIQADFAVDATGGGNVLGKALGSKSSTRKMRTRTRSIYTHFENVGLFAEVISSRGHVLTNHPFPCDDAALHHVIDGGWMWVLRFNNGITSAGFSLDTAQHPANAHANPETEWQDLLRQYPSIRRQFIRAKPVRPLVDTGRLQRRLDVAAGDDWAALPYAAGFVDPFLSAGFAHTLFGIERLTRIFAENWNTPDRSKRLADYSESVFREMRFLDRLVASCVASFDRFEVMTSVSMIYFVAAVYCEERIRAGLDKPADEFLLANDTRFTEIVDNLLGAAARAKPKDSATLAERYAEMLKPYNQVGFCDPEKLNLYPFVTTTGDDAT